MSLPLEGVRVLDLTQTLAGPFGTMMLGDLGAEIIKIENPNDPDVARRTPPHFIEGQSVYFVSINRNKRSLCLDLKNPDGRALLLELVRHSDVVVENFRAGVMDRLDLGYETLSRQNPRIIYCSLSGFGATGPWRDRPGYDYLIQALSGLMAITGDPEHPPTKTGISMVDHLGGVCAALAVIAALYRRTSTGEGARIDLSLLDVTLPLFSYLAANLLNAGELPERVRSSGHPYIFPCQLFRTRDGYVVVMAMNDRFWRNLCRAMDRPDLENDPELATLQQRYHRRDSLLQVIEPIFLERTTEQWLARLEAEDVPVAPVSTLGEALSAPQVQARGMVSAVSHPVYGKMSVVANPIRLSGMNERTDPAPILGEHTAAILSEVLGLSRDQIDRLRTQRVIRTPEDA